ncbi:hypothetical protein EJB05_03957, partial [Eragrostis curvula]
MVGGRSDRGWGREGFSSGRFGRGAGRDRSRQDYTWRREQEWIPRELEKSRQESGGPHAGKEDEPSNRDRWEGKNHKDEAEVEQHREGEKFKWGHREEMMENSKQIQAEGSKQAESHQKQGEISSSSSKPIVEPCYRCGDPGHIAQMCPRPRRCDRCGGHGHTAENCRNRKYSDYVAPLCATQVEGQSFFCIPDCPSDINLKERSTTAIITEVSGSVNARQLEQEFKAILGNVWRWTARPVGDNKFTVRFPIAQLIKDWGHFRPLGLRTVQAQIAIDPWTPAIEAKPEMQQAWFRVRGIPYDKRSEKTLAYVGSLVGSVTDIDERSLHKLEYVRMKICCRDVTKVPATAEGAIIPFLYEFSYEREIFIPSQPPVETVQIAAPSAGEPSTKKPRMDAGPRGTAGTNTLQIAVTPMPQRTGGGSQSAPPKTGTKFMHDAQKGYKQSQSEIESEEPMMDDTKDKTKATVEVVDSDDEDDDLLSEEFGINLGGECEGASSQHTVGLVICPQSAMHKEVQETLYNLEESYGDDMEKKEETQQIVSDLPAGVTEAQRIQTTRQSSRIQDQVMNKMQNKQTVISNKRNLEVLSNPIISDIANEMDILLSNDDFETVELLKDLEIARHALQNKIPEKCVETSADNTVNEIPVLGEQSKETLLLEWEKEDSDEEAFTLVIAKPAKMRRHALAEMEEMILKMPAETALNAFLSLLPDHSLDLLSQVDLTLQIDWQ